MPFFNRKPRAKCPVTPDDKTFLEANYQWMIGQFGPVSERRIVLPSKIRVGQVNDYEKYSWSLIRFCCGKMEIDPEDIDLELYFHGNEEEFGYGNVHFEGGLSHGEYHHRNRLTGKFDIHLNAASLRDPEQAVATIAHELGHLKLIGEGRIRGDEETHEYLTDLLVIYFGFGIFQANTCFTRETWSDANWSGWQMYASGYLPKEMTCHALAVHAYLQQTKDPAWTKELEAGARKLTRGAIAYLFETEDCMVTL